MFDKDAYKVQKVKKPFLVQLNDGTKILQKFNFFLNEFSKYSGSPQSILEFLNDNTVFIPVMQLMSDRKEHFMLINKNEICYLTDEIAISPDEGESQLKALFHLSTGFKFNAAINHMAPKDQSRIVDYLSLPEQFIKLILSNHSLIYLNKKFITKVIPA